MERLAGLWVQHAGIATNAAETLLARLAVHGQLLEPVRTAHLIARALGAGESRQRA